MSRFSSRFSKFAPAVFLAVSLAPIAAHAGASGAVNPAAPSGAFSQGHFDQSDSLAGSRQAGFSTYAGPIQTAQGSTGLSQGHFSNTDPLAGERQNPAG